MKITHALSIRQPWAWLIIHAGKDIENRRWKTTRRGPIYVHAAKGMTLDEYRMGEWALADIKPDLTLPPPGELERGGIIGTVEIVHCVQHWDSPWFHGPYGFVLEDAKPTAFIPCRGLLNFFIPPAQ